jgi:protein farnesyltransferase/geranylgeranyltransferase type-1 subunit alpha
MEDVRNNSAWNQRYFVITSNEITDQIINDEINYSLGKIHMAPNNESPWNYCQAIFNLSKKSLQDFPEFEKVCVHYSCVGAVLSLDRSPNRFALLVLLKDYKKKGLKDEYADTCALLLKYDPKKSNYYEYLLSMK